MQKMLSPTAAPTFAKPSSVADDFFLQSQFLPLEGLDHRGIGRGPGHFVAQAGVKAGMLALKSVEVGRHCG